MILIHQRFWVSTAKELSIREPPADSMQAVDPPQPEANRTTTTTTDATKDSGSTNADQTKTQDEKDDTLTQAIEAEMDEMDTFGSAEDLKANQEKIDEPMSKVEANQKDRVDVQLW